ncbi:hydrolase 1, exosortase A system-associated [Denitromonas iodatirespirans]|uniref:Hydrolase 1, exosortase A system-associated n=1 Tax=Denitromonas iodatirespirans TaxID=2795389 RepID=A0A944H6W6_DENI1|nr:hydrolase 1, exosortase A system-associated [Denitromonas iodatirespirans]MBT0960578.1 hydrolase 1, exosortase A system-associated [Denitromonas iodatirespirans]
MSTVERPVLFECAGETLVGIVAAPERPMRTGVLVLVGGPQYRVGSHRQFVMLSRALASRNIACMRFDFRGMGDATGEPVGFDAVGADIAAALKTFRAEVPGLERVVIWGLCDGASAACLFARGDASVAGLMLLNPWVRTEATRARTYLKHYYPRRLLDRDFWMRLMQGEIGVARALKQFVGGLSRGRSETDDSDSLPERMIGALHGFDGAVLVGLSGHDYVAREFEESVRGNVRFDALRASGRMTIRQFSDADHTFSAKASCEAMERACVEWIEALDGDQGMARSSRA